MEYRVRRRSAAAAAAGDGVSDALVRRFLLRAGFRVSSDRAVAHARQHLAGFVSAVVGTMRALMNHDQCTRFKLSHVVAACRAHGVILYGYDDVCALERSARWETYHVTEMVESCTSFGGPEQWDDEPDVEPGARFAKTDFAANYKAFVEEQGEQEEDSDDDNDSEWSWYGESDAESESGDEAEAEEDSEKVGPEDEGEDDLCSSEDEDIEMGSSDSNSSENKDRAGHENRFIKSLRAAQAVVDAQLLCSLGSDGDEMDEDAPAGQGYFSDVDNESDSTKQVAAEDQLWETSNSIHSVAAEKEDQAMETLFSGNESDCYVMSRLVFAALFRDSMVRYEAKISTVALSALHNAAEQYLHRALTEGVLSYQLKEMIREDEVADLEAQLQEEREKVASQEQAVADLQAALHAKEVEMQRQISQLQRQLATQQRDKENLSPNNPATSNLKALGKRKTSSNSKHVDDVRKEFGKNSTAAKSTPGSLRAKTHSNTLRAKRTRVNQL